MAQIPDTVRALMRPSAAELEPYDPAFTPVEVNLSANENSYGLPAEVRAAVNQALAEVPVNRYPDPLAGELRAEIAAYYGLAHENVICGNGGDELIYNIFLAFGGESHTVLHCPPDFSVYELYASLAESPCESVWRDPATFAIDWEKLRARAADATVTIVTTPNNPTGTLADPAEVEALALATDGLVLVDEAYMEFADMRSCASLISHYPNVLVLRTFSKAFALAGARLGYVLADPGVVSALAAVRQPYSVGVLSQTAALAAWRHRPQIQPTIDEIVQQRGELYTRLSELGDLGVTVWPSSANFLLVRLPHAHEVRCRLRDEHSVLVRDFSSAPGLTDCLRITVGTPEENKRLVDGIVSILREA